MKTWEGSYRRYRMLTLFRMGFFGCCSRMGGDLFGPLSKICHTYTAMMKCDTVIPFLRKIQKIYKSRDTSIEFSWHQHFFTWNQQILPHQKMEIYIGFWCIISSSLKFSWIFNNCFNKHGYNFDDISKNS